MSDNKRAATYQPAGGHPAKRSGGHADEEDDIANFADQDEDAELQPPDEEAPDIDLGEAGRNWCRPDPGPWDTRDIVFQQLEVDHYIAHPMPGMDFNKDLKTVAVMRMFGVNEAGNSVCVFVHGFQSYFYVEKPKYWSNEELESAKSYLNGRLADKTKGNGPAVVSISVESKTSIWNFQNGEKKDFLKVVLSLPTLVAPCRGIFEIGFQSTQVSIGPSTTYESNVLFAMRFMIDRGIVGCSWITVKAGRYKTTPNPLTYCQLEAHVRWDDFESHLPEGEWSKVAPIRILSFDIECAGRKGHFPDAKIDPVIQIANMVTIQGESSPKVKNVMTLGTCAGIVGAEVMAHDNERALLMRWLDLLLESDPDVIIGYNIINFDLPYLFERATALGIDREFHQWGRVRNSRARMRDTQFSSKAYGTHDYKDITVDGRVQFDLMVVIQREHKLSSYSLNAVSAHFLNEQKEDVHHSCITDLQNGNEETRRRLAVYCLKDAYLPQRLLDKLMFIYNHIEMARVTGVPMSYLLSKGQSIKVFSQILRKSRTRDMVCPSMKVQGSPTDGVAYEGATVLEPKVSYYTVPIATLDFASLYPSIMMANNLCYSTLVTADKAKDMNPEDLSHTPSGDWFVKSHRCKGVLPEILEELLGARKRAKNDLKAETDPFKRAVLDGRQMALKVSANSVYGFTGAIVGKMPCLAISASTTAYGRTMIEKTKELVEARYTIAQGYEANCDVVYGDTDSVMVRFGVTSVARAMELGKDAAEHISTHFTKPIKLEFEKVYYPFLLMKKKRYAGLLWTRPEIHDKMDTKGIETVRRDNCQLVRNVVTKCLELILIKRDAKAAELYVKGVISDLLNNRIDLSLLVVSKSLSKDTEAYEAMHVGHVELAKKMRKRDPATAPQTGDRIPYVIIKAAKGAKAYEKTEDPIYALENNLPIDTAHYLEHQLSQPLLRIFEPVMKDAKQLLTGDHTRSITVCTPSSGLGGIMKFAKVRLSCLGCKAPLTKIDETSLCEHCKPKQQEIFTRNLKTVNELEDGYAQLWTQCQRCQGSLHQDVLCTSRDCPIFYRRKKVQKDLNEAQTALSRFDDSW